VASMSAPRPGSIRAQVTVTADTQSAVLLLGALPPLAGRFADVAGDPTLRGTSLATAEKLADLGH
jgi:hypothetical protein